MSSFYHVLIEFICGVKYITAKLLFVVLVVLFTSSHGLFAVAVNWNSLAVLFFCSVNIVFCSSAKWGVRCLSHRKMVMMLSVDDPSVFP